MHLCEYLEHLYYRWKYRNRPTGPLVRSKLYETKVKELLLEDLNAMKFTKVIEEL